MQQIKKIIRKRKGVTKQEINTTLRSIYSNEDGRKIDMKVRKVKKQTNIRKILISLILFFALIATVSWLGIIIFSKWSSGGLDNLMLDISGEKKVVAGKEAEYKIKYINKEDIPLAGAEISIYFPKSFVMSESKPVLDDKNKLKIGSLKSGEGRVIDIRGKFFATENSKEIIQVVLTYKPSNFNSNFQKVANLEIEIIGSIFDGSLEAPDVSIVGEDITYRLTYKNKSDEGLDNVAIDAILPTDFIITTSTPQIDKKNRWNIGKLEGKSEGEVEITGTFPSETKGNKDIILKLGIIDEEGAFLSLIEKNTTTEIIGGDLITSILINGVDNFSTIQWGESLNYSIVYKNEGNNTLYDVILKIKIIGLPQEKGKSIIDWSSISDAYGGKIDGDYIVWTKKEVRGLDKIKSGEEGIIDFGINVIKKPTNPSYNNYKVDSILEANISRVGNVVVKRTIQSKKIVTFINSDVEFISQARFYDDDNNMVGSGPVPPRVDQKTTYKIYWIVNNSMHELEDIVVSAKLPEGVVFSGASTDAGSINLDASLKKVVWSLNRMPTSVNKISSEFNLSIKPISEDRGSVLGLLEEVEFRAIDKSTGGIVLIKQGDETTALPDEPFVTSSGTVLE